jgi:parallel beta-helix repeat protein
MQSRKSSSARIAATILISLGLLGGPSAKVVGASGFSATEHACQGVELEPSDDVPRRVSLSSAGSTFCFGAGTYRLTEPIRPLRGQRFLGAPDSVISGARLLTDWDRTEDGAWAAHGQTQEGRPNGTCLTGEACRHVEDVYYDDRLLTRVLSLGELAPGRFFFDYAADVIYIAEPPEGHTVEVATAFHAFKGEADSPDVEIRGLLVEKFANPAQKGAVFSNGAENWTIRDNEVQHNHGTGISASTSAVVDGNLVHHNGQKGIGAMGADIVIENNEIAWNNTVGFNPGWEAGGTKFAFTDNLLVRNNHVHHNLGNGLWTDIDNVNTIYEGNRVTDNWGQGIFHEISYDAVIRNNVVKRNGFGRAGNWLYGAGILVGHSPNVEVYGNRVVDNYNGIVGIQQDRGSGAFGPYELRNLYVHDNVIKMGRGRTGVGQTLKSDDVFTRWNNRFERNIYHLASPYAFNWMMHELRKRQWRAYGNDTDGRFRMGRV